ncbi:SCAPER domain-containing protein short spindle 3 isoform X1 [Tachypleus tridentatus]|uniref:SCAPER domain-containing protein short spindle 3 isoform X1 n=2 Tax=Tachypleus tridentatus TaxID=6853 RepID=UPI003FD52B92
MISPKIAICSMDASLTVPLSPVEKNTFEESESGKLCTKPPVSPRPQSASPKPQYSNDDVRLGGSCHSRKRGSCESSKLGSRARSASAGRNPQKDLRARYWAFLFDNLSRAVDEIYQTCEMDESILESKEAIMMLETYIKDFQALIQWLNLSKDFENTPPPNRPVSLAWEVRKTSSPGRAAWWPASVDKLLPSHKTVKRTVDLGNINMLKMTSVATQTLYDNMSGDSATLCVKIPTGCQRITPDPTMRTSMIDHETTTFSINPALHLISDKILANSTLTPSLVVSTVRTDSYTSNEVTKVTISCPALRSVLTVGEDSSSLQGHKGIVMSENPFVQNHPFSKIISFPSSDHFLTLGDEGKELPISVALDIVTAPHEEDVTKTVEIFNGKVEKSPECYVKGTDKKCKIHNIHFEEKCPESNNISELCDWSGDKSEELCVHSGTSCYSKPANLDQISCTPVVSKISQGHSEVEKCSFTPTVTSTTVNKQAEKDPSLIPCANEGLCSTQTSVYSLESTGPKEIQSDSTENFPVTKNPNTQGPTSSLVTNEVSGPITKQHKSLLTQYKNSLNSVGTSTQVQSHVSLAAAKFKRPYNQVSRPPSKQPQQNTVTTVSKHLQQIQPSTTLSKQQHHSSSATNVKQPHHTHTSVMSKQLQQNYSPVNSFKQPHQSCVSSPAFKPHQTCISTQVSKQMQCSLASTSLNKQLEVSKCSTTFSKQSQQNCTAVSDQTQNSRPIMVTNKQHQKSTAMKNQQINTSVGVTKQRQNVSSNATVQQLRHFQVATSTQSVESKQSCSRYAVKSSRITTMTQNRLRKAESVDSVEATLCENLQKMDSSSSLSSSSCGQSWADKVKRSTSELSDKFVESKKEQCDKIKVSELSENSKVLTPERKEISSELKMNIEPFVSTPERDDDNSGGWETVYRWRGRSRNSPLKRMGPGVSETKSTALGMAKVMVVTPPKKQSFGYSQKFLRKEEPKHRKSVLNQGQVDQHVYEVCNPRKPPITTHSMPALNFNLDSSEKKDSGEYQGHKKEFTCEKRKNSKGKALSANDLSIHGNKFDNDFSTPQEKLIKTEGRTDKRRNLSNVKMNRVDVARKALFPTHQTLKNRPSHITMESNASSPTDSTTIISEEMCQSVFENVCLDDNHLRNSQTVDCNQFNESSHNCFTDQNNFIKQPILISETQMKEEKHNGKISLEQHISRNSSEGKVRDRNIDDEITGDELQLIEDKDMNQVETMESPDWNDAFLEEAQEWVHSLGLSWGDQMEYLELELRTPGRALQMHEKLSSPYRKKSRSETIRRHEEKLAKAQEQREKFLEERAHKFKDIVKKAEEMKAWKEEQKLQRRITMEQKLLRAEQKRKIQLQMIKRKAHDEEEKVNEIAFINTLEAQNKWHDIMTKRKDHEARLQDIQEERQRRQEEKAAKEAAAEERRRVLEAERIAKLQEIQEKRKLKDKKIEQQQQEKEKERQEIANQKARDREMRLQALSAAQQAVVEGLQKKIQQKQEESARRHEENMEQIRQKAFELSVRRYSSVNDDVPRLVPYEVKKMCILCNVLIGSEVYLLSHLLGKKHQQAIKEQYQGYDPSTEEVESYNLKHIIDAPADKMDPQLALDKERQKALKKRCKKLRQRMTFRGTEYEDSWVETVGLMESENKTKIHKNLKEIAKCLSSQSSGPLESSLVSSLDRALGELQRIFSRGRIDDLEVFNGLQGISTLMKIVGAVLETAPKVGLVIPSRVLEKACVVLSTACGIQKNCYYMVFSNKLGVLLDYLSLRLNGLFQGDTSQLMMNSLGSVMACLPVNKLAGMLMHLLAMAFKGLGHPSRIEHHHCKSSFDLHNLKNEEETQQWVLDVVSYTVSIGIVDKLCQYHNSVCSPIDESQNVPEFLLQSLDFLTSLADLLAMRHEKIFEKKRPEDITQLVATFQVTELVGIVSLLYSMLLHSGAPSRGDTPPPELPHQTVMVTVAALKLLNQMAVLDLQMVQNVLGREGLSLQLRHIASYLIWYCSHWELQDLLCEVILMIGYFTVLNLDNQTILQSGQQPTILQQLCALPFQYFSDFQLMTLLYPTLISCCHDNSHNRAILEQEMSPELLANYIEECLLDLYQASLSSSRNKDETDVRWILANRFPKDKWTAAKQFFTDT